MLNNNFGFSFNRISIDKLFFNSTIFNSLKNEKTQVKIGIQFAPPDNNNNNNNCFIQFNIDFLKSDKLFFTLGTKAMFTLKEIEVDNPQFKSVIFSMVNVLIGTTRGILFSVKNIIELDEISLPLLNPAIFAEDILKSISDDKTKKTAKKDPAKKRTKHSAK